MKSINFEFLRPKYDVLANLGGLAEAVRHVDPGSALTRLRSFGEEVAKTIYKEESLPRFPQATFYELTKNPVFAECVDKSLIHQLNFLRIQGNDPAHDAEGDLQSAKLEATQAKIFSRRFTDVRTKKIPGTNRSSSACYRASGYQWQHVG